MTKRYIYENNSIIDTIIKETIELTNYDEIIALLNQKENQLLHYEKVINELESKIAGLEDIKYPNKDKTIKNKQYKKVMGLIENTDGELFDLTKIENLLNEQEKLIKRLKQIRKEQIETILKQKRKMKELMIQLQTEEGVCIKCKYHNLIKYPDESSKYYISKCIKEHDECSKEDIRYCEDFKLISDDENV